MQRWLRPASCGDILNPRQRYPTGIYDGKEYTKGTVDEEEEFGLIEEDDYELESDVSDDAELYCST